MNIDNAILIDVRSDFEYAMGHVEGAKLLDFNSGQFQTAVATMDKDAEYLLYCRSGSRAMFAQMIMQRAGISKVENLGTLENASRVTGRAIVR
ncbi:MAG: rhodanese-like domain-containing protein [Actinomycetaceae bacterium]|nr:rhodanese-like domain-containing protein [Actinomycetaceae bacterium]